MPRHFSTVLKESRGPSFKNFWGEAIAPSYPPCGDATESVDLLMEFETNSAKQCRSWLISSFKIIKILGQKRKMGLGFSPMVLCVVQRLCASTFFRPYRTLHLLLISKAEISHEHCERTVVFLEPLSFCQQREVTKSLQLKSRCV